MTQRSFFVYSSWTFRRYHSLFMLAHEHINFKQLLLIFTLFQGVLIFPNNRFMGVAHLNIYAKRNKFEYEFQLQNLHNFQLCKVRKWMNFTFPVSRTREYDAPTEAWILHFAKRAMTLLSWKTMSNLCAFSKNVQTRRINLLVDFSRNHPETKRNKNYLIALHCTEDTSSSCNSCIRSNTYTQEFNRS